MCFGPQYSPPWIVGSINARTIVSAPVCLLCAIGACTPSRIRFHLLGSLTPVTRGVRPPMEYPGCATTESTGTSASRSRASASKPSACTATFDCTYAFHAEYDFSSCTSSGSYAPMRVDMLPSHTMRGRHRDPAAFAIDTSSSAPSTK